MRSLVLLIILFSSAFSSEAASKKKQRKIVSSESPQNKKSQVSSYIDETQRFISIFWTDLNYNMDSFFSNQKYSKTENDGRISAYLDFYRKEGESLKTYFDISIKVDLPKLSHRLSITIEKERDDILESRSNQITNVQATKDSDYAASVNYLNLSDLFNSELNVGIRFAIPLDPFVKYRIFKDLNFSWFDLHLEQKFIYFKQEYFSESTQIFFAKKISDSVILSQNNILSWSDSDDLFVLRDSLILSQKLSNKKSISYSVGANASFTPTFYYTGYDASLSYKQVLYKTWLYGSLGIGAEFLRTNEWGMTNFAVIRTEVFFQ
ncbi:MAG: hypothetical protein HN576_06875 [Bacteriovoracaceae bacterium]|jgi:hypothetical protein|nr:hypothetical protein [Bacteriovoracaceae bacterium]